MIAKSESKMFPVASNKIAKEKLMAVIIPVVADRKKARSVSIQHQLTPAV